MEEIFKLMQKAEELINAGKPDYVPGYVETWHDYVLIQICSDKSGSFTCRGMWLCGFDSLANAPRALRNWMRAWKRKHRAPATTAADAGEGRETE